MSQSLVLISGVCLCVCPSQYDIGPSDANMNGEGGKMVDLDHATTLLERPAPFPTTYS